MKATKLMLYMETIAVCYDMDKQTSALYNGNVELLNIIQQNVDFED